MSVFEVSRSLAQIFETSSAKFQLANETILQVLRVRASHVDQLCRAVSVYRLLGGGASGVFCSRLHHSHGEHRSKGVCERLRVEPTHLSHDDDCLAGGCRVRARKPAGHGWRLSARAVPHGGGGSVSLHSGAANCAQGGFCAFVCHVVRFYGLSQNSGCGTDCFLSRSGKRAYCDKDGRSPSHQSGAIFQRHSSADLLEN